MLGDLIIKTFESLLKSLKYIRSERVYLCDNTYMDNFQLSPQTLGERIPVLRKRIKQLKGEGIVAGVNSGATIGHMGDFTGAERLMDLDWWQNCKAQVNIGIACPLGPRFHDWIDIYFKGLASTETPEIFVDDDLIFCPLFVQPIVQ